ncbi:MAG: hypothetical protein DME26_14710 [Verrucomicrobia bacterium]|nr:MAG: hypothetical protein DME26_14710 [Verrucomicrobiota bacterium]
MNPFSSRNYKDVAPLGLLPGARVCDPQQHRHYRALPNLPSCNKEWQTDLKTAIMRSSKL